MKNLNNILNLEGEINDKDLLVDLKNCDQE